MIATLWVILKIMGLLILIAGTAAVLIVIVACIIAVMKEFAKKG